MCLEKLVRTRLDILFGAGYGEQEEENRGGKNQMEVLQ